MAITSSPSALPEEIVRAIDTLDPLPVTAQQIVKLANGEDVSLATIADLVENDQAVAASVLRLGRTVRFAGARPPGTVREAVSRVGVKTLLDVVMGDYLKKVSVASPAHDLTEHDHWFHGVAARFGAVALAEECRTVTLPADVETAALLHDVGKLVLARALKGKSVDLAAVADALGVTFIAAERAVFGTDHAAVGAALARAWQFPDAVTDAIARHHEYPVQPGSPAVDAVVLANVIAKTIEAGMGGEGLNLRIDVGCYRRLGIDFASFSRACLRAQAQLAEWQEEQGLTPRKATA